MAGDGKGKRNRTGLIVAVALVTVLSMVGALAAGVYFIKKRADEIVKQREEEAKRLTSDNARDATEPVEDEVYRLRLEVPGEGWKTLGADDAHILNEDAIAGAVYGDTEGNGAWLMLFCEHRPNPDLDTFVRRLPNYVNLVAEAGSEPKITPTRVGAHPAVRIDTRGLILGRPGLMAGVAFARGAQVCSAVAWATGEDAARHIDLALGAVKPLDGDIGERPPRPSSNAHGAGWRVEGGVLESAAGVRVRPNEWCRAGPGSQRTEVVLQCKRPAHVVSLMLWQQPKADADWVAYAGEDAVSGYKPTGETRKVKRGADEVALHVGKDVDGDDILGGAFLLADGVIAQVVVSYAPSLSSEVLGAVGQSLAMIEPIAEAERGAVARDMAKNSTAVGMSDASVYRGGVFRDFERGLTWTRPSDGTWRVRVGDDAAAHSAGSFLWVWEPSMDLELAWTAVASPPSSFHEQVVAEIRERDEREATLPQQAITWGDISATVTLLPGGDELRHDLFVATAVTSRGVGIRAEAHHPATFGEAGRAAARRALEQLSASPPSKTKMQETSDDLFRERRLGFEIWLPSGLRSVRSDAMMNGGFHMWSGGRDRLVGVVTLAFGEGTHELLREVALQSSVGAAAQRATGPLERSDTTLAGVPGKRILIPMNGNDLEVRMIERDDVMYLFLVALDDLERKRAMERFQLLDKP
jgi:hypothetical protein